MAPKLTAEEKKARGTLRAADLVARPLPLIREEIADAEVTLEDMKYNLRQAGLAIRREGVLIDVITRNNGGNEVRTKKLNPACKLQKEMLTAIKAVKRALVLLREEEALALKSEVPEVDEFAALAIKKRA